MGVNKRLIGAGATGSALPFAGQNFKHITYTGDNSTGRAITGVGFKPDLIFIKPRNQTEHWNAYDTTRGPQKQLLPNTSAASTTQTQSVQSFDSDGWTMNGDNNVNKTGINYSAWCWKANGGTTSSNSNGSITSTVQANTSAGFSIVQWTGTGSNATIGHGLSSAPEWLVVKKTNASGTDWVWKNDVALGAARALYLNDDVGEQTDTTFWQSASPTSTVFSVGTSDKTNGSGNTYIAYCWHSVAGFSNSTTGSQYIGTGDSNGPTVNLGFEPSIIIIKSKDGSPTTDWKIYTKDTNEHLSINTNGQAGTNSGNNKIDFFSNGFKISGNDADINASGQSYNYYAYAADPDTEAPTLASSFNIETYRGNNSTNNITGLGFSPNFVWNKATSDSRTHNIFDSVRGAGELLTTNNTNAESTTSTFNSFDSDGFTVSGTDNFMNNSSHDYVAWTWKADDNEPTINSNGSVTSITSVNDNAKFSVVKATAPSSGVFTVGHGLSSALDFFVIKRRDSTGGWIVYFRDLGSNKYLLLNDTAAAATDTNFFDNTHPTSTVFTLNAGQSIVGGADFVAYCFANVTAYQKFGTYTGTGSAGQTITTGFKPDFILLKSTVGTANWHLYDTRRERGLNQFLQPNNTDPQEEHVGNSNPHLEMSATGFSITADGVTQGNNASGLLYVYWAIAKNVPSNTTLANSFKTLTWTGTSSARSITGLGFNADLLWIKQRTSSEQHYIYDKLRGPYKYLHPNLTSSEGTDTSSRLKSFDSDGFSLDADPAVNGSGNTYVAWAWKAGNTWQSNSDGTIPSIVNANTANGFSIVKYHGDSASSATIGHGLSSAPELIITKALNFAGGWATQYNDGSTAFYGLRLNENGANNAGNGNVFYANTAPTSSVYTVGGGDEVNDDYDYVSYCFHSVAGYSKIGTYSGGSTGSGYAITTGFQPDWIMIKRTDTADDWTIIDSERGDGSNSKRLIVNNSNAEKAATSIWFPTSTGFYFSGTGASYNASGGTYIYMTFKMN